MQNIRGRDRGALYFRIFFAEVRDRVVGSGRLDAATLDAASALLEDPNLDPVLDDDSRVGAQS